MLSEALMRRRALSSSPQKSASQGSGRQQSWVSLSADRAALAGASQKQVGHSKSLPPIHVTGLRYILPLGHPLSLYIYGANGEGHICDAHTESLTAHSILGWVALTHMFGVSNACPCLFAYGTGI